MSKLIECPGELSVAIMEFFPSAEWENAAEIAELESGWNAFADVDTTTAEAPCGASIAVRDGVHITAEHSVGYFQINVCNHPDWDWRRLWNARENVGTAHAMWDQSGWRPWLFSARKLGLL